MSEDQRQLLLAEMAHLRKAAAHLQFSVNRCEPLLDRQNWAAEELERLESLCSRFARLADLLTQRVMRLVDYIELTPEGSLLDRIYRAEKRGWGSEAGQLVRIRELRNVIAHEYAAEKMPELYAATALLAPQLLAAIPKVTAYCEHLAGKTNL